MINTVLPNELIGANYKGHAIRSTVNLLVEAIGIEPSKYTSDLCEWYLQSGDLKFYLYSLFSNATVGCQPNIKTS